MYEKVIYLEFFNSHLECISFTYICITVRYAIMVRYCNVIITANVPHYSWLWMLFDCHAFLSHFVRSARRSVCFWFDNSEKLYVISLMSFLILRKDLMPSFGNTIIYFGRLLHLKRWWIFILVYFKNKKLIKIETSKISESFSYVTIFMIYTWLSPYHPG